MAFFILHFLGITPSIIRSITSWMRNLVTRQISSSKDISSEAESSASESDSHNSYYSHYPTHTTMNIKRFIEFMHDNPPILMSFFSALSPATMIRYSRASTATNAAFESYLRRVYNVTAVLCRFFEVSDITSFRSLQAETGALISGSVALQFFDRTLYPESDLDLYVDRRYSLEVGLWLLSKGYKYRATETQNASFKGALNDVFPPGPGFPQILAAVSTSRSGEYTMRGVAGIFNFYKPSEHGDNPKLQIQLIAAEYTPIEVILNFHSTVVMNIISHRCAYSLFPKATLEQRRSLISAKTDPRRELARSKYINRGWSMVRAVKQAEREDLSSDFRMGDRWIGDPRCWTISLQHLEGHRNACLARDNLGTNNWRLEYGRHAEMQMSIIGSPILRQNFVVVSESLWDLLQPLLKKADLRRVKNPNDPMIYYDDELAHVCRGYHQLNTDVKRFLNRVSHGPDAVLRADID